MRIFVAVVDAGGFSRAARALSVPKSFVSRKVALLEEHLGVRLLNRTTRSLSLTDAGREFHEQAARVVASAEEAERTVTGMRETPSGLLRITAPVEFGIEYLGPVATGFMARYPEVRLDLALTDRTVDLVEEGVDLAIRATSLADSSLIARPLGKARFILVASPKYLAARGVPKRPSDLTAHDAIVYGTVTAKPTWILENKGRKVRVPIKPRQTSTVLALAREAALAGLGIAFLPSFLCVAEIRRKSLVPILERFLPAERAIHVVYPARRHLAAKTRAFLDYLREKMTPPPWEMW
ncbi:MAG: LysR family transcriptional regulator [Candidatus Hydrogenedentota bacterium]